jgi:DNA helicase-2/ATP-dependent DNA helicase PcrA
MNILQELNTQQIKAVTAGSGPILVLAGPGSGKTRVLTFRIAYLINEMGVKPYNILAVTFTNKAAREMKQRVEKLETEGCDKLWIGTFHSVCARILRREEDYLPVKSNFVILDEDDQLSLIKRIFKEQNISDKLYRPTSVLNAISTAKNNLILPDEFQANSYRDEIIRRVYQRYQAMLVANNGVDFDDLLLYTWRLLKEQRVVREKYSRRYEHILVDEFQDTNTVQYEMLRLLATYHHNIFVVGDEDQSIYRWRGADYRNVLRFEQDYAGFQKILLERNYRSTQTVLDAAVSVIDQNRNRTRKELVAHRELTGEKVSLYEASDDHAEAAYVVDTISQLVGSRNARLGDFAVMYRTNAQSRLVEEAFLRSGLPYHLVGAQRFYGRREIKDLIAYLRLVQNPRDELSLARVINVPGRGIGDKTLVSLQLAAQRAGISPAEVLLDLAVNGSKSGFSKELGSRANLLGDFGSMLAGWLTERENLALPELFDKIINDTVYKEYIDDGTEEGKGRWENVQELKRLTYEYADRGLAPFLENLALVSDQDTVPDHAEAPTLLTLHAAKGLEFNRVFIIGLDDGVLPHSRSLDEPEEMAEERRLFYVGITRARNNLYLVRAEQRSNFGNYQYSIPSRFLEDIPEELLRHQGGKRHAYGQRSNTYSTWESRTLRSNGFQAVSGENAPIVEQRYRGNMRVRHPVWGEGLVVDSRLQDGDETVDVFFESVGFKRLAASLANLEILGS